MNNIEYKFINSSYLFIVKLYIINAIIYYIKLILDWEFIRYVLSMILLGLILGEKHEGMSSPMRKCN